MRWVAACSRQSDPRLAVAEVSTALEEALEPGRPVDLALAFLSAPHVPQAAMLAGALRERLAPSCLAAASAHGVVGGGHEIESGPALSVIAAQLPGVTVSPFLLMRQEWTPEEGIPFDSIAPGRAAPSWCC